VVLAGNVVAYSLFEFDRYLADNLVLTSANDGVLLVAWGLLFWGLLGLRSSGRGRGYGRLFRAGIGLAGAGLALCTIVFFVEAVAPLAGLSTLGEIGVLTLVPLGSVVLGGSLLRSGAVSRLGGVLMVAAGPSMLAAMFVGELLPFLVGAVLFAGVLGSAWAVVGYDLRTRSLPTERSVTPSA